MSLGRSIPIHLRLASYAFVVGTVLILLVVSQMNRSAEDGLRGQLENANESLMTVVADLSVEPLLTGDVGHHGELLAELVTNNEEILTIDVIDLDDQIILSSDPTRVGRIETPSAPAEGIVGAPAGLQEQAIAGASGDLGRVRVVFDEALNQLILDEQRNDGLVIGMFGVAVAALLSMVGGWAFTRRLSELSSHVAEVDDDGLPVMLHAKGSDEIASVAAALDARTGRIRATMDAIIDGREALRLSEARLQLALSAAVDTVLELDLQKQEFSVVAQDRLGLKIADFAGPSMPLKELVHDDDRDAIAEAVARSLAKIPEVILVEARVRASGGGWRTALMRISAIEQEGGDPVRVLIAFIDITDQREIERQLAHADKMNSIGQLTSGITHDFNNILAISALTVSQLEEPDRDRSGDDEKIERLARANELAGSLVKRLLIAAGPQFEEPGTISTNELVHEVGALLGRLLGAGIETEIKVSDTETWITMDEGRAQQVLLNVGQNAADAMSNTGQLTIRSFVPDSTGGWVEISVADSGPGIDPSVIDTIFDPFVTTKALGAGTGLGLATSYTTVTTAGGTISASNNADGPGATFTIRLPRAEGPTVDLTTKPASISERTNSSLRVLVVEDHPDVLELVSGSLEDDGYEVLRAASPSDALAMASTVDKLHLLLTDVHLPMMSGVELSGQIKLAHPGVQTLYMSGFVPDLSAAQIRAEDLIHKPFSNKELLDRVRLATSAIDVSELIGAPITLLGTSPASRPSG